ncbi:MAG: DNA internalization-related competence protein ComEC/Rec2 [Actinomycetota bacterium]|nr:DNA internalization-related competence protein ComEC/Rec2 [Actinomycetota bacterium]
MLIKLDIAPLLLTAPYVIGILIADYFSVGLVFSTLFLVLSLIACLIAVRWQKLPKLISLAILFFFLGLFLTSLSISRLEMSLLSKAAQQGANVIVEGTLASDPIDRSGTSFFNLNVEKVILFKGGSRPEDWMVKERLRVKNASRLRQQLCMGEHVRVSGVLRLPNSSRDFNFKRYLYHQGIVAILIVKGSDIKSNQGGFSISFLIGQIRHWVKQTNNFYLPKDCAGLINGIVLGDPSLVDEEVQESFRATGLTHIVAASGVNIALVISALWPLLRIFRLGAVAQFIILICSTGLYTMVSGMSPSITRAFLMAAIGLVAWLSGRQGNSFSSLSAAAMILLVIDPFIIYDIGFQLSFAATASIIIFVPSLERLMEEIPKPLMAGLSVTVGAQIGVLPIIIYYFGQLSMISLIANLVVIPLASIALVLGMAALPVAAVSSLAGSALYLILRVILKAIIFETISLSAAPGASIFFNQPSIAIIAMLYAAIVALAIYFNSIKLKLRLGHVVIVLAVMLALPTWWYIVKSAPTGRLEITFMDVGQGDSAIVTTPRGERLLIDGGPNPDLVKQKLARKGVRKIDAILISHDHADHITGIKNLLGLFTIGCIIYPKSISDSKGFLQIYRLARKKGINLLAIDEGDVLKLGEQLEIDTLFASIKDEEGGGNDDSLVVMVKYGDFKALFTGDAEENIEKELVSGKKDLDADVLKVGHHGSAISSTREFLHEVSPEISVISVGKDNKYGHPSKLTIGRLINAGSKVYRTDRDGDVTISLDDKAYRIYAERR